MPRLPNKICHSETDTLRVSGADIITQLPDGYRVFVTDTTRGRCNYNQKSITVPLWATKHIDPLYSIYYIAHECAHAINYEKYQERNHGAKFMEIFKQLCPSNLWFYELNYKPRLAKEAGIKL